MNTNTQPSTSTQAGPQSAELINRALAAHFSSNARGGKSVEQPIGVVAELEGRVYVALRDAAGGPVAVYRHRRDGKLKLLRRVPGDVLFACSSEESRAKARAMIAPIAQRAGLKDIDGFVKLFPETLAAGGTAA